MTSIQLTQEHKDKLLEMCKYLFPECDSRLTKPVHSCPNTDFVQLGKKTSKTYEVEIHWFEFCVLNLATVIYNKLKPSTTITLFRGYICQEVEHPIDYLYQEYLKIKK